MQGLGQVARDAVGGLPGQFWVLWTAAIVNRAGGFVMIYMTVYLTTAHDFSTAQAGFVVGLYGAGGAAGVIAGGHLADRWGRRPTVLLAMGSAAVLMLALGFADRPGTIMPVAAALGVAAEAARPPLSAMIADIVPPADRIRAFSIYFWALNLGFAGAAVLAGFATGAGYLTLFVADAATTAAAALLILLKMRETRPVSEPGIADQGSSLLTVLRDRVFVGFASCNLLISVVLFQHTSTLPVAMAGDGLPPQVFGLVIALNGLIVVAGQLFVTHMVRDRRPAYVMPVAALVIGAGFGLTALADTPAVYATTVFVWTCGEMLNAPAVAALSAGLSPASMRGRYQSFFTLSWQGAAFLAPTVGGFVHEKAGNTGLWLGCLAVALAAAGWNLAAAPARQRRAGVSSPVG